MDQLLAGEYFTGFVWCAGPSQRAAGHRWRFQGAVPTLPSAGCAKGLCSPEQQTALSAAADSGGAPRMLQGSCQHHLPNRFFQTLSVQLVLISSAWEEAF